MDITQQSLNGQGCNSPFGFQIVVQFSISLKLPQLHCCQQNPRLKALGSDSTFK